MRSEKPLRTSCSGTQYTITARIMRAVIVYYVPLQEVSNGFSDRMSDSLRTEWPLGHEVRKESRMRSEKPLRTNYGGT